MRCSSFQSCAAVLALMIGGNLVVAEDESSQFRLVGHEEFGWVPYSPRPLVSIPPVPVAKGEPPLKYPATILNYADPGGKKQFILSIATDPEVDHRVLRLSARDAKNKPVLGVSFSVTSVSGPKHRLITFHCAAQDVSKIRKLVIIYPTEERL